MFYSFRNSCLVVCRSEATWRFNLVLGCLADWFRFNLNSLNFSFTTKDEFIHNFYPRLLKAIFSVTLDSSLSFALRVAIYFLPLLTLFILYQIYQSFCFCWIKFFHLLSLWGQTGRDVAVIHKTKWKMLTNTLRLSLSSAARPWTQLGVCFVPTPKTLPNILDLSPVALNRLIKKKKNLCHFVSVLMRIVHGHVREQRANFVWRRPEHSVCPCLVFGTYRLCLRVDFQNVIVPGEHCTCVSHMLNVGVLCRGYCVQGWALPSFFGRLLVQPGASLARSSSPPSCWLPAVSSVPPSSFHMWLCLCSVWSAKSHWKMEDFSSTVTPSWDSCSDSLWIRTELKHECFSSLVEVINWNYIQHS